MPLTPGTQLSHYEMLEPIGKGGMGEVYRAKDSKLGRDVAIKILPDEFAQDDERLRRFQREAKVLASLNHPNIAAIYGLERSRNTHYLVLELVSGETLADRISRGPIPMEEALEIAKKIAEALEEAHEQGIVHRDLKPANVKLTPKDKVKVLDFGLAKALVDEMGEADGSMSPTLTRDATGVGVILGTAAYMSPEQAKGKPVDKSTDIFAFGAVLYEMLTGKKAFRGDGVSEVLAAVIKTEPDWTALARVDRPDVVKLVRWCLVKDPSRRLRDIGDARALMLAEPSSGQARTTTPCLRSLAALALGALIAGFAGWIGRAPVELPSAGIVRFLTEDVPYTETIGGERSLDLAPDGRHLAYITEEDGQTHLKLRALDQAEALVLAGTEGVSSVFFSPDSEHVMFKQGENVMSVSLEGGTPTKVVGLDAEWLRGYGLAWGSDGTIVYPTSPSRALWRTSSRGMDPTPVAEVDVSRRERSYRFPHLLPDGRHVLLTVDYEMMDSFDDATIAIVPLDGAEKPRALVEGGTAPVYASTGHIVYARAGSLLAVPFDLGRLEVTGGSRVVLEGVQTSPLRGTARYALSNDGTLAFARGSQQRSARRLVWINRRGESTPLPLAPTSINRVGLSPDGKLIGLDISGPRGDLWLYEIERGVLNRLTHEGVNIIVDWHPDGKRLLYRGINAAGEQHLSEFPVDGRGPNIVLRRNVGASLGSWSPDGTRIAYSELGPTSLDIHVLTVGDAEPEPFVHTAFDEMFPRFAPDGEWIAYASNESGRMEIYVEPYPGPGRRWQISTGGGREPSWSPDGTELFYLSPAGERMMVAEMRRAPELEPQPARILFEGPFSLYARSGPTYSVHPDGERFLMLKDVRPDPAPIEVIVNWFEELKRLVPTN